MLCIAGCHETDQPSLMHSTALVCPDLTTLPSRSRFRTSAGIESAGSLLSTLAIFPRL